MQSLEYLPYNRLGATANIIVDSVPLESTVVTLSHWPASGCPDELKADLSAEIVFNFLQSADAESIKSRAAAVSNNHYDEDGLVGIFALLYPEEASANQEFLLDIATAGDFGTYKNREAAHVSFVLQAWAQPDKSPLNSHVFRRPYEEVTSILYEELLPRFSNLFQRVHFLEQYWIEEDRLLEWSEQAIARGDIQIREFAEFDFSVVVTPESKEWAAARPKVDNARWTHSVCHQFAVHNATNSSRILVTNGQRHDFYYRYETWVETVSRKPKPRLDLQSVADRLNKLETKKIWVAENIKDIVPHLMIAEKSESKLGGQVVQDVLMEFFAASNG